MIKMVLSTDMAFHMKNINELSQLLDKAFGNIGQITNNDHIRKEEELKGQKNFILG